MTTTTTPGASSTNASNLAASSAGATITGRGASTPGAATHGAKLRGAAFSDLVSARGRASASLPASGRPSANAGAAPLPRAPTASGDGAALAGSHGHGHGRHHDGDAADDSSSREGRDAREKSLDALCDPMARHAAQMGPPQGLALAPMAPAESAASHATSRARASLEEILPSLVKRIAWSGDGKRGTVRMELGAGALEGGTLLIHSDAGRVRVQLHVPPGTDVSAWRDRITARLGARGIDVDSVEVD